MIDNKKIRGWMIRILHRAYPAGLEADTLFRQLHEMGYEVTRKEFDANVQYLIDDGFVQIQKFGGFSFEDTLNNKIYKVTTKGVDLAEKTISDEGVSL